MNVTDGLVQTTSIEDNAISDIIADLRYSTSSFTDTSWHDIAFVTVPLDGLSPVLLVCDTNVSSGWYINSYSGYVVPRVLFNARVIESTTVDDQGGTVLWYHNDTFFKTGGQWMSGILSAGNHTFRFQAKRTAGQTLYISVPSIIATVLKK
jgi:hypothetical protein